MLLNHHILVKKKCKYPKCSSFSISIYGQNNLCRHHVESLCHLSNTPNIFNTLRCNSTVSLTKYCKHLYCNSHFRTLIFKCSSTNCETLRYNNVLCYDKLWYCDKHRLDHSKFLANMFFIFKQKSLPPEIVFSIWNKHFKNNRIIFT